MNRTVKRDATEFGRVEKRTNRDQWEQALRVARSCESSQGQRTSSNSTRLKVSYAEFARTSGVGQTTVKGYVVAWGHAADAGVVPAAGELEPGQSVRLPDTPFAQYHTNHPDARSNTSTAGAVRALASRPAEVVRALPRQERENLVRAIARVDRDAVTDVALEAVGHTGTRPGGSRVEPLEAPYAYLSRLGLAAHQALRNIEEYEPDTDLRAEARRVAGVCEMTSEMLRRWATGTSIADEVSAFLAEGSE